MVLKSPVSMKCDPSSTSVESDVQETKILSPKNSVVVRKEVMTKNYWKLKTKSYVTSTRFEFTMMVIVGFNTLIMCVDHHGISLEAEVIFEIINLILCFV